MATLQFMQGFISERLHAAVAEILGVFEQTIVQYETEIDQQRKLLDIILNPEIKLHRIDLPQQHSCKVEDVLTDQQLCNQKKNSILDQVEPEPPQVEEEQQELCINLEGDQHVLNEKTDPSIITATDDGPEPNYDMVLSHNTIQDISQQYNCRDKEILVDQQVSNQEGNSSLDWEEQAYPKVKEEQQELCNSLEGEQHVLNEETDPSTVTAAHGSNRIEPEPTCNMFLSHNSPPQKKSLKCKHCGKSFSCLVKLNRHQRTHKDEKPFSCKTCGKCFSRNPHLTVHMRTHTGEKPFSCKLCQKCFSQNCELSVHMRTHTGEKPFSCKMCRKQFSQHGSLTAHMRTHTGEKPFSCKMCGKCFSQDVNLTAHMRTHTGEKPFSCTTCGKQFSQGSGLTVHMRTHTGEKPFSCKICGKCFSRRDHITAHMRTHTDKKAYVCKAGELSVWKTSLGS